VVIYNLSLHFVGFSDNKTMTFSYENSFAKGLYQGHKMHKSGKAKKKTSTQDASSVRVNQVLDIQVKSLKTINVSGVVVPLMRNYNSVVGSVKT